METTQIFHASYELVELWGRPDGRNVGFNSAHVILHQWTLYPIHKPSLQVATDLVATSKYRPPSSWIIIISSIWLFACHNYIKSEENKRNKLMFSFRPKKHLSKSIKIRIQKHRIRSLKAKSSYPTQDSTVTSALWSWATQRGNERKRAIIYYVMHCLTFGTENILYSMICIKVKLIQSLTDSIRFS